MKKILILFLLISSVAFGQKIPDYGFNKVRLTDGGQIIQAELKPVSTGLDIETDRIYYWYASNLIHVTQGGFSGRLLNGSYTSYYLNKNLHEQGTFNKGLKDGNWNTWDENGLLATSYTWKKGIKDGKFTVFNNDGKPKQTGYYYSNLLNGKVYNYNDAVIATAVVYDRGIVVTKKPSTFWKKINIFKRTPKPAVPAEKPKPQ